MRLRASPRAVAAFGEVFGDAVRDALDAAPPPDERGWREATLSFEHETAAAHRLAGFGGDIEVLRPDVVRTRLLTTAQQILERYQPPKEPRSSSPLIPPGGIRARLNS